MSNKFSSMSIPTGTKLVVSPHRRSLCSSLLLNRSHPRPRSLFVHDHHRQEAREQELRFQDQPRPRSLERACAGSALGLRVLRGPSRRENAHGKSQTSVPIVSFTDFSLSADSPLRLVHCLPGRLSPQRCGHALRPLHRQEARRVLQPQFKRPSSPVDLQQAPGDERRFEP